MYRLLVVTGSHFVSHYPLVVGLHYCVLRNWMSGHQGIKGNKKTHDLARKTAQNILIGPEPNCAVTYDTLRTTLKQKLLERHTKYLKDIPGLDVSKFTVGRIPWTRGNKLIKRTHQTKSLPIQDRKSKCPLVYIDLRKIKQVFTFCHCKYLQGLRKQYFGVEQLEGNEMEDIHK